MSVVHVDAVIVGGGVAGLSAALSASGEVALISKAAFGEGGSTPWAQGGIAVALGDGDSPVRHAADTLAVGGGLNDADAVAILTESGPARVRELISLGARFDRDESGRLVFGREAGHRRNRILHANGDATGAEIMRALSTAVAQRCNIAVADHTYAADLIVAGGRVCGVTAVGPTGGVVQYLARAVVLATGGIGRLYAHTTNPIEVNGDGHAMAARAGARLVDLEFVQFHPTALAGPLDPMPLLTEALRGAGAVLVDGSGNRYMADVHPDAELAPRDVVARATWDRLRGGSGVFLDATEAVGAAFPERFPTVFSAAMAAGLDPRVVPLPVSPAAHYHMGGIAVDTCGRTSLPGLWAVGEVASTGVHGANRLASNSLLEGLVFGARAAENIASHPLPSPSAVHQPTIALGHRPEVVAEARSLMWQHVGLVRDRAGLEHATERLGELEHAQAGTVGDAANMTLVARLVATAALRRRESRGAHYRSDFPETAEETVRAAVEPALVA